MNLRYPLCSGTEYRLSDCNKHDGYCYSSDVRSVTCGVGKCYHYGLKDSVSHIFLISFNFK